MNTQLQQLISNPTQLLLVPAALIAVVLHELAHGIMAYWCGDNTARDSGRLSLNPLRHIDIVGLLALIILKFGWAKPVPVNTGNFRHPKRDMAFVALAGPMCNFLQALIGLLVFNLICVLTPTLHQYNVIDLFNYLTMYTYESVKTLIDINWVHMFMIYYVIINIGLGVFNLIPIPPLDGSKVVGVLLPVNVYSKILRYEQYGMVILVVLLFSNLLNGPLNAMRTTVLSGLQWLAALPVTLFGG